MSEENVSPMHLGDEDAPVKVEIFLNMACPYCVNFFKAADTVLLPKVKGGKVRYTIKHYDKPKVRLLHGTIANLYLDYADSEKAYEIMKDMFENQKAWHMSDSGVVEQRMKEQYGLKEQRSTMNLSLQITKEAVDRGIEVAPAPTVFINDEPFKYDLNGGVEDIEKELLEVL